MLFFKIQHLLFMNLVVLKIIFAEIIFSLSFFPGECKICNALKLNKTICLNTPPSPQFIITLSFLI